MQVDVSQLLPRGAPAAIPAPIPGVGTAGALLRPARWLDTSASVIRLFERLGWAIGVHWPDQARLATRRIS